MALGFHLVVPTNETFAFLDRTDISRCSLCDRLLERPRLLGGVVLGKRGHALSYTLDGGLIAADAFVRHYRERGLAGLEFTPLPHDSGFHATWCGQSIPFDAKRRKTAFVNKCRYCRRYEQVIGSTPVMVAVSSPLAATGFFTTDIEFGLGDEQHPLLLAGATAARLAGELDEEIEIQEIVDREVMGG